MYTFPDVNQLREATIEDLKELKTGFRAPYIYDAVSHVYDGSVNYNELIKSDSAAGIEKCAK